MLCDSWTIAVKEWREWCGVRAVVGWGALIVLIAAWSVIAPQMLGHLDAGPLILPVVWAALPFAIAGVMVTDSIAGERERQTLETLLASRLPDRAIILGKIMSVSVLGWGLLLVGMIPGLLQQWSVDLSLVANIHPLVMAGVLLGISALGLLLVVIVGALISLYTSSARFALLLTIAFVGAVILGATGLAFWWVAQIGGSGDGTALAFAAFAAGIIIVDAFLFGWLLASVHRDRLLAIG